MLRLACCSVGLILAAQVFDTNAPAHPSRRQSLAFFNFYNRTRVDVTIGGRKVFGGYVVSEASSGLAAEVPVNVNEADAVCVSFNSLRHCRTATRRDSQKLIVGIDGTFATDRLRSPILFTSQLGLD